MQTQENTKTLDQQFTEQSGIDVSKRERGTNLNPVIGMGVTRSINGDSYPYTIIDILDFKGETILKIQGDYNLYSKYKADYRDGEIIYIKFMGIGSSYKDIKWNKETKRWNKGESYFYSYVGERSYHLDPSF
tara:strand:+ start:64 stop:459 length:396 start_codon:yes stop_codon:yes gene_type:complete